MIYRVTYIKEGHGKEIFGDYAYERQAQEAARSAELDYGLENVEIKTR